MPAMDSEEYAHRPTGPRNRVNFCGPKTESTLVPKWLREDRRQRDWPAEGLPHLGVLKHLSFTGTKKLTKRRDEEEFK